MYVLAFGEILKWRVPAGYDCLLVTPCDPCFAHCHFGESAIEEQLKLPRNTDPNLVAEAVIDFAGEATVALAKMLLNKPEKDLQLELDLSKITYDPDRSGRVYFLITDPSGIREVATWSR